MAKASKDFYNKWQWDEQGFIVFTTANVLIGHFDERDIVRQRTQSLINT